MKYKLHLIQDTENPNMFNEAEEECNRSMFVIIAVLSLKSPHCRRMASCDNSE